MIDTATLDSYLTLAVAIGAGLTLVLAILAFKKLKNRSGNDAWTAIHVVHSLLEPDKKIIMEAAESEDVEDENEGDPPQPGFDKNKY